MSLWEMALEAVMELGPRAKLNRGRKSERYQELRREIISCAGPKETSKLLREAFETVRPGVEPVGSLWH